MDLQVKLISVSKLSPNVGQVAGLPKNPRFIKDDKFKKLVNSLREDPEMMQLREVIAYDNHGELVIICGNMRFRAAKELGLKEVPCKILPTDTDVEKLKAYTIKDNAEFGQNDWDALANEWDTTKLSDWGIDTWQDVASTFGEFNTPATTGTDVSVAVAPIVPSLTEDDDNLADNLITDLENDGFCFSEKDLHFFGMTFQIPIQYKEQAEAFFQKNSKQIVVDYVTKIITESNA